MGINHGTMERQREKCKGEGQGEAERDTDEQKRTDQYIDRCNLCKPIDRAPQESFIYLFYFFKEPEAVALKVKSWAQMCQ